MVRPSDLPEDTLEEEFPRTEAFYDCCGSLREFQVHLNTTEGGHFLRAVEETDQAAGYEFAAHHAVSPFAALGVLRSRIAEGLATRYLIRENGRRHLGHDKAVGHIGYGSVVIDGEELSFDELTSMLQTYEGWRFELRVVDPFDAL
jgi:hypothetical protein